MSEKIEFELDCVSNWELYKENNKIHASCFLCNSDNKKVGKYTKLYNITNINFSKQELHCDGERYKLDSANFVFFLWLQNDYFKGKDIEYIDNFDNLKEALKEKK